MKRPRILVESTEKQKEGSGGKKGIGGGEEIVIIEAIVTPATKAVEVARRNQGVAVDLALLARGQEGKAGVAAVNEMRVVGILVKMRVTAHVERTIGNATTAVVIVVVKEAIGQLLVGEIEIMIKEARGIAVGMEMIVI